MPVSTSGNIGAIHSRQRRTISGASDWPVSPEQCSGRFIRRKRARDRKECSTRRRRCRVSDVLCLHAEFGAGLEPWFHRSNCSRKAGGFGLAGPGRFDDFSVKRCGIQRYCGRWWRGRRCTGRSEVPSLHVSFTVMSLTDSSDSGCTPPSGGCGRCVAWCGRAVAVSGSSDAWVEGEISTFRAPDSGHLYFTFKDGKRQIRVSDVQFGKRGC